MIRGYDDLSVQYGKATDETNRWFVEACSGGQVIKRDWCKDGRQAYKVACEWSAPNTRPTRLPDPATPYGHVSRAGARGLVDCIEKWNAGEPIDRRRLNRHTKIWWRNYVPEVKTLSFELGCYPVEVLRLMYERLSISGEYTGLINDLPKGSEVTVYQMLRARYWLRLGVYPASSRHHTGLDLAFMERFFLLLDQHQIIYFQSSGSVWRVDRREDK